MECFLQAMEWWCRVCGKKECYCSVFHVFWYADGGVWWVSLVGCLLIVELILFLVVPCFFFGGGSGGVFSCVLSGVWFSCRRVLPG